jgi:CubicO group peptidase (beta-lactamase class C family)
MKRKLSLCLSFFILFASCRSSNDDASETPPSKEPLGVQKEVEELSKKGKLSPFGIVQLSFGSGTNPIQSLPAKLEYIWKQPQAPDLETPIPLASATKWLVSVTLLRLVDRGLLKLDDPIWPVFFPQEPPASTSAAALTLRQLLRLQSGLDVKQPCDETLSFQDCARAALNRDFLFEPGKLFLYASLHLNVSGAAAEVATGKSWAELFDENVSQSLNFRHPVGFYSNPFSKTGVAKPGLGGGVVMAPSDYARFLVAVLTNQDSNKKPFLSATSLAALEEDGMAAVGIRRTPPRYETDPFHKMRYALGHWRVCDDINLGSKIGDGKPCPAHVFASPGAFGFFPWIDRKNNSIGIIVMLDKLEDAPEVLVKKEAALFEVFRKVAFSSNKSQFP